jgi:hypothetical protein
MIQETAALPLFCRKCGRKAKTLYEHRRCLRCSGKSVPAGVSHSARLIARVAAWVPPPCCTRCSGPGPLSKRLKLCQECLHRHNERQQRTHRVYRLVSTPKDHRMELQVDEDETPKVRCPTCGVVIDSDLPACSKHMTIVLLKRMRTSVAEV